MKNLVSQYIEDLFKQLDPSEYSNIDPKLVTGYVEQNPRAEFEKDTVLVLNYKGYSVESKGFKLGGDNLDDIALGLIINNLDVLAKNISALELEDD